MDLPASASLTGRAGAPGRGGREGRDDRDDREDRHSRDELASARRRRSGRARAASAAAAPERSLPPLARGSMTATPWRARPLVGLAQALLGRDPGPQTARGGRPAWAEAATRRRTAFAALIALSAAAAAATLWAAWPRAGLGVLHAVVLALFTVLFGWIAAGFWTALAGFMVLLRGGDRFAIDRRLDRSAPLDAGARTAIVMPICNEDVATVFGGLRATVESLVATREAGHFDVYVLSDTRRPDLRVQEIVAFEELRAALGAAAAGGLPRIHYRWRGRAVRKKAGNVADFCRRWGRNYRYLVVLDADSIMSGDCLTALVRLMEAHPDAGIIQTAPRALGPATPHGRVLQFVQRVTGPLYTAGMQYWQLGESHYWGHNAIIRTAPFMQHAALARLPARRGQAGLLDGDVMSHDFVEAALLRRAGYHVWVAHQLAGSYEQVPPSLATELQRDRRWCLGNLQNARLIGEPGLHPVHRAVFLTGALSYGSAPLWLGFLLLSTLLAVGGTAGGAPGPLTMLAVAPDRPAAAGPAPLLALFVATAGMLVLPKLLALVAVLVRREQRRFGGALRLFASGAAELVLSVLLAPVRMMFHAQFVLAAGIGQFTGWKMEWRSPPRGVQATSWRRALHLHGLHAALAALWLGGVVWALGAGGALWLAPVLVPLLLAIPLSVLGSLPALGRMLRRWGLFAVPEEVWPPAVLRAAARYQARVLPALGFADAVANPAVQGAVTRAMGPRDTQEGLRAGHRLELAERAAARGLASLTPDEQMRLLSEPQALALLRLWLAARGTSEARASATTRVAANTSAWADGGGRMVGGRGALPRRAQRRQGDE